MNYYYLLVALPSTKDFQEKAFLDIERIQAFILEHLSEKDKQAFRYTLYRNDNKNLLSILKKKYNWMENPVISFHTPAAFTYQELESGIEGFFTLPKYMQEFLSYEKEQYKGSETENFLIRLYFQEASELENPFLKSYFEFKRDIKNVLSAINRNIYHLTNSSSFLEGGLVYHLLKNSTGNDLRVLESYDFIEEMQSLIQNKQFIRIEKRVDEILLKFISSYPILEPFSSDAVFARFLQLSIQYRWLKWDENLGLDHLNQSIEWVLKSATMPNENTAEIFA